MAIKNSKGRHGHPYLHTKKDTASPTLVYVMMACVGINIPTALTYRRVLDTTQFKIFPPLVVLIPTTTFMFQIH